MQKFGLLALLSMAMLGILLSFRTNSDIPSRVQPTVPPAVVVSQPTASNPDSSDIRKLFPSLPEHLYDSIFQNNAGYLAEGFDFPVGKPDAKNYFKAQTFGQRLHLGEDWNGKGGGNTDLGDPVYSSADGLVTFSDHICCGWGNVVRVVHRIPQGKTFLYVESLYAHLHNMNVKPGDLIKRGQQLGTIGTADGRYSAHLHFEMRDFINMSIGPGYSEDQHGYLNPTKFIKANRP